MTSKTTAGVVLLLILALAACGDRDSEARRSAGTGVEQGLPTPVAGGSVTGTAEVGPGGEDQAPSLGGAPAAVATERSPGDLVIQDGAPAIDPTAVNPETGLAMDPDGDGPLTAPPAVDTGAVEPTAADAVAVVRAYYSAINGRNYGRAYGLWSGNGSASGQTPPQFAAGFAQTQGVSVEVGAPGEPDAGAGQRHIQVPIALSATQTDGSVRRYAGSYTLHRTVVDGAAPEQRDWRIQAADLREVSP